MARYVISSPSGRLGPALTLLLTLMQLLATAGSPAAKPDPNDPNKPARPLHRHPQFRRYVEQRKAMVATQLRPRGIADPNVLAAMETVPRHAFVRPDTVGHAYRDSALPIEAGQTISQPYIVAFMTEALKLEPNSVVLEIGTGSGYQAAVCAEIARKVYTIEIVDELAKSATRKLKTLGYPNVEVKSGDGYFGWPERGPFDAIIGTAAAGKIPPPLIEQLKPGGTMIIPQGSDSGFQYLVLITKNKKGEVTRKKVMPVRFVPMTGRVRKE